MQHYIICRVTNALQIRAKKDKKEKSLEKIEFSRFSLLTKYLLKKPFVKIANGYEHQASPCTGEPFFCALF
jgi:hypothetical protein